MEIGSGGLTEEKERKQEIMELPRYGFTTNLHQTQMSVLTRIDFLEKLKFVKSKYAVMYKNIFIAIIVLALVGITIFIIMFGKPVRARYLFLPFVFIVAGVILLLFQYIFIDPSSGSLLAGSFKLMTQLIKSASLKFGAGVRMMDIGERVKKNGLVIFRDGQYGYVYLLDGNTSRTSFHEEVVSQIVVGQNYHKIRERSTTEIKITSSQLQDCNRQLRSYKEKMRKQQSNRAKRDIVEQINYRVEKEVDGAVSTTVQYLILKNKSLSDLEVSLEKLKDQTQKGLYYSLRALDKKETKRLLSDIRGLK